MSATGGYAWDDCGAVGLIVPAAHVWDAYSLMQQANPKKGNLDLNSAKLVEGMLAEVHINELGLLDLRAKWRAAVPAAVSGSPIPINCTTPVTFGGDKGWDGPPLKWKPSAGKSAVRKIEGGVLRTENPLDLDKIEWPLPREVAAAALRPYGCEEGIEEGLKGFGETISREEVETWFADPANAEEVPRAEKSLRDLGA